MSTELALPEGTPLVNYDDKAIDSMLAGGYLPRLQVMGSNSDLVKDSSLPLGHLALIWTKDKFVDLGTSIDVMSITVRPKAIRMTVPPVAFFNQDHPEFKKIQVESNAPNSQCAWGPEFLLYIPGQGFATFHMGSKSARRESGTLVNIMRPDGVWKPMPATVGVKFIPKSANNPYSWHAPLIKACTTPVDTSGIDPDDFNEQLQKFNHPPETKVEAVVEESRPR